MEISITLIISIISIIIAILSFINNGKREIKNDTEKESYRQGQTDATLKLILDNINEIKQQLKISNEETDKKIDKAIKNHENIYHNKYQEP